MVSINKNKISITNYSEEVEKMKGNRSLVCKASLFALMILFIISGGTLSYGYEWEKTFGGDNMEWGYSVQQTTDGGYIIAGLTRSFGAGHGDVYLIKTDALGCEEWSRTFGGIREDWGLSVQQTTDGGYIISGLTEIIDLGGLGVYLIKTDALGNEEWHNNFGTNGRNEGWSVQQTTDGGYIIAGFTWSSDATGYDVYLIKTDALGNEEWSRPFEEIDHEFGKSVQQTTDGGYIITGDKGPTGGSILDDVFLIKTDASGNEEWSQTFGGSDTDGGSSVQQTTDGGYIIAGSTKSFGAGDYDVYLIKTDALGNEEWNQTFGGIDSDHGLSVQQTTDGGYIIAGWTNSFGAGSTDFYLIKTDALGNELWNRTFGGSNRELGMSVQQTTDGGYIITGYTDSFGAGSKDFYLVYYNPYTLDLNLSYTDDTLYLDFYLGTFEPVTWNVWLSYMNNTILLRSRSRPVIDPPIHERYSIPRFPSLGTIGVLTTFITAEHGIVCSDWETVYTGPVAVGKKAPNMKKLRRLFKRELE